MLNDTLANSLSALLHAEQKGLSKIELKPSTKMLRSVLSILNENGYVGSSEVQIVGRGNTILVNLAGSINKTGAIKPRFSVKVGDFEKYEKQFLPAKDFGVLIVSTQKGVMTHINAKKLGVGGKLLAFCY